MSDFYSTYRLYSGLEEWVRPKIKNQLSADTVINQRFFAWYIENQAAKSYAQAKFRSRFLNFSLLMSGITASQMQRSDEMQEAIKRAASLVVSKSIQSTTINGSTPSLEVLLLK